MAEDKKQQSNNTGNKSKPENGRGIAQDSVSFTEAVRGNQDVTNTRPAPKTGKGGGGKKGK